MDHVELQVVGGTVVGCVCLGCGQLARFSQLTCSRCGYWVPSVWREDTLRGRRAVRELIRRIHLEGKFRRAYRRRFEREQMNLNPDDMEAMGPPLLWGAEVNG